MKYSASLDGIRALAILPVVAFHVAPALLPGGFTGVDAFFVLSGYLIVSVIRDSLAEGTFSVTEFYLRRVQRLLPNALVMVCGTVLLCHCLLLAGLTREVGRHGIWTLCNLSNYYMDRQTLSYWSGPAERAPLLHTWSLAVEEQFYLLLPLVLVVCSRWISLLRLVVVLGITSYLVALLYLALWPYHAFFPLQTRAWEPLLGAAWALFRVRPKWIEAGAPAITIAGWVGLAVMVAGWWCATGAAHPGVQALAPTLATLAVIAGTEDENSRLGRFLSWRPFVFIGLRSYSIYLWHWPLLVIARQRADIIGAPSAAATVLGLGSGLALALIAYRAVELPLRDRGAGRSRRLGVIAVTYVAVFVLCCFMRDAKDPHLGEAGLRPVKYYGFLYDASEIPWFTHQPIPLSFADVDAEYPQVTAGGAPWSGYILHAWGPGAPRVVVVGSSHACMYGRLIDEICRTWSIPVAFLSVEGRALLPPEPAGSEQPDETDAICRRVCGEWKPDLVIAADRWDTKVLPDAAETNRKLTALLDKLKPTPRVAFVEQVPSLAIGDVINLRELASFHVRRTGARPRIGENELAPVRSRCHAWIRAFCKDHPGAELLEIASAFREPGGAVRWAAGDACLFLDDDHLADAGTLLLRPRFEALIRSATHR